MPANLNALIRYKTINSCLYGGKRRWSIPELIERCSDALAEYRGLYKTVSERTIRDDIRIMRSEILGYNAPIEQKKGFYYYSDPDYSIMTISLTDSSLVERIIRFLDEIKPKVAHPELEIILEKLNNLRINGLKEEQPEEIQMEAESPVVLKDMQFEERITHLLHENRALMSSDTDMLRDPDLITWGDLFHLIKQ
jgi:hypothetical protein